MEENTMSPIERINDIISILDEDGEERTKNEELKLSINKVLHETEKLQAEIQNVLSEIPLDSFNCEIDEKEENLYECLRKISEGDNYSKAIRLIEKRFGYKFFDENHDLVTALNVREPSKEQKEIRLILVAKSIKVINNKKFILFEYLDFHNGGTITKKLIDKPIKCAAPETVKNNDRGILVPLSYFDGKYSDNSEDLIGMVFLCNCTWEKYYSSGKIDQKFFIYKGKVYPLVYPGTYSAIRINELLKLIRAKSLQSFNPDEIVNRMIPINGLYDRLVKHVDSVNVIRENINNTLADLDKKIDLGKLILAENTMTDIRADIRDRLQEVRQEAFDAETKVDSYNEDILELNAQIAKLEAEIREKEEEKKRLEEKLDDQKNQCEKIFQEHENYINKSIDIVKDQLNALRRLVDENIKNANDEKERYFHAVDSCTEGLEHVDVILQNYREKYYEHYGENQKCSPNGLADSILSFIYPRGFKYTGDRSKIVKRFISAVGSGQIILLLGKPGMGKSTLPRLIAESVGAHIDVIPVQPNWTDDHDLWGYIYHGKTKNEERYCTTRFLDFIEEAQKNSDSMYFVVLDEMNMSRIEYYFAGVLSAMERDGILHLIPNSIQIEQYDKYKAFKIPENVQFIGTVTLDSLAKEISPKVLDRSVVIDLDEDLYYSDSDKEIVVPAYSPILAGPSYFGAGKLIIDESKTQFSDLTDKYIKALDNLSDTLNKYKESHRSIRGENLRISYRFKKKMRHMVEMGADYEDIIAIKFLPTLNWEVSPDNFDEIKKIIIENVKENDKKDECFSLERKLDAMKDETVDSIIIDYMRSARR